MSFPTGEKAGRSIISRKGNEYNVWNSKRAKRRREQEEKLRRFKEEIQEVPLERNDYLAMVLGAFWALWPVLAIVAGVVLCVVLFFFR